MQRQRSYRCADAAEVFISLFDNTNDGRVSDFLVARDYLRDQRLQKLDFSCISLLGSLL
ncbi:MAG: hypothetical protein WKI04_01630 [Ferruginibacter sp.]